MQCLRMRRACDYDYMDAYINVLFTIRFSVRSWSVVIYSVFAHVCVPVSVFVELGERKDEEAGV